MPKVTVYGAVADAYEKPMTMNKWKILQFSDETLDDLD